MLETRAPVRPQQPRCAADRSDRAGRQHRRASPRSGPAPSSPTAAGRTELYQVVEQPVAPGRARMRSGPESTSSTTTTGITFPRAVRGSYTFSSLANFLAGALQQRWLHPDVRRRPRCRRRNPNLGIYAQDEWKVGSRVTLNLGLRYDLQFLETINTDSNNISPRIGVGVVAVRVAPDHRPWQRRPVLRSRSAPRAGQRAALGRQHDRPGATCVRSGVSLSPSAGRRAGLSRTSCRASCRR